MVPGPFTLTPELSVFFSHPGDRAQLHRSFCFWQSKAGVHGGISWGRPDERDIAEMCDVYEAQLSSPIAHWPSIVDVRGIESIGVVGFETFVGRLVDRAPAWRSRAKRQAIVHHGGFVGALVLGALHIGGRGLEIAAFDDHGDALAWVGAPEIEADYTRLRASLFAQREPTHARTALAEHFG